MVKKPGKTTNLGLKVGLTFVEFLAIAAFFLFEEHRAHMLGVLPFFLVLLCPLLHVFMHGRGHGSGDHEGHEGTHP